MLKASKAKVLDALRRAGVERGDGLLVHSAVQFLGKPEGGVGIYLDALKEATGPEGTIVTPAFNFAFAKGEPFDPAHTLSQGMGVFSEHVRTSRGAMRSTHPMQSVSAIGVHAQQITSTDTPSAFDPGSPFDQMVGLNFKLLLLGADIQASSMIHYSEQRNQVPYRYWKEFSGQVYIGEKWEDRTYRMFVRDLDLDAQLDLSPIQRRLQAQGRWGSAPLNYGKVSCCRLRDFVAAADAILAEDPWALVANRKEALRKQKERERQGT